MPVDEIIECEFSSSRADCPLLYSIEKREGRSKGQKREGPEQSVDKGGWTCGPTELLTFEGRALFIFGNRARRDTDPKNIVGGKISRGRQHDSCHGTSPRGRNKNLVNDHPNPRFVQRVIYG